jgi:hypothetical protein
VTLRKGGIRYGPPDDARIQADIAAAMRVLPLPDLLPPRPNHPDDLPSFVVTPPDVREQIISHLAEKYVDMARASDTPPAKGEIESQFAKIKAQATELLLNLARLREPAIDALHLERNPS